MPTKKNASSLAFLKKKHYSQEELQGSGAKNQKKNIPRVKNRVATPITHPDGIDYVNDAGAWGDLEMGIQTFPASKSPPKAKESILAKRKLSFLTKKQGKKQKSQHEIEMEMGCYLKAEQFWCRPKII